MNVKIPKELIDLIDRIVSQRIDGYRGRAEFVNAAVREYLRRYEERIKEREAKPSSP